LRREIVKISPQPWQILQRRQTAKGLCGWVKGDNQDFLASGVQLEVAHNTKSTLLVNKTQKTFYIDLSEEDGYFAEN
jgi:hypothetical protein